MPLNVVWRKANVSIITMGRMGGAPGKRRWSLFLHDRRIK